MIKLEIKVLNKTDIITVVFSFMITTATCGITSYTLAHVYKNKFNTDEAN